LHERLSQRARIVVGMCSDKSTPICFCSAKLKHGGGGFLLAAERDPRGEKEREEGDEEKEVLAFRNSVVSMLDDFVLLLAILGPSMRTLGEGSTCGSNTTDDIHSLEDEEDDDEEDDEDELPRGEVEGEMEPPSEESLLIDRISSSLMMVPVDEDVLGK
jgi:hypothetical protein